jgi:NitT/TauT family transport system substrate-binding protein
MFVKSWRAWGRRGALLGVLVLAVACNSQSAAPAAPKAAATPEARAPAAAPTAAAPVAPAAQATAVPAPIGLRFAYTALSTSIAPYWIAEDAGYFREEGLDLDNRFISASTVGMQSLLAREIDVTTVTGGAALQAAANGGDIAIFATSVNAIISQLVTAPDVTTPEQLRGQPLGVVRFGTVSDFVAKLLLRGWGLEPGRDVPLVQLGGQAETIGAMQSGGVKSVVVADLPALECGGWAFG